MSVNKVILVGNVGKDPETRYLDENTAVCKFPLATSEVYKNRTGERVEQTEWHNIVMWRGLAQVAEKYVKKGTQLYIEGRVKTRSYDDRDGVKKYITEIVADNMQMLSRKQQGSDDYGGNTGSGYGGQGSNADSGYGQGNTSQQEQQGNATPENAGGQSNSGAESSPDNASHQSQQGPDNDLSPSGDEADDLPF